MTVAKELRRAWRPALGLLLVGVGGGLCGALFFAALAAVTAARLVARALLFCLPAAGLVIVWVYRRLRLASDAGVGDVLRAVRTDGVVTGRLGVGIFVGAALTHLCGGSAGREGAALQLGGSLGSVCARALRTGETARRLLVSAGMSAVFAALFGTPFAAAVFCCEIVARRRISLLALGPNLVAALTAAATARLCGVAPTRYALPAPPALSLRTALLCLLVTAAAAGMASLFCAALHGAHRAADRLLPNPYLRVVCGGLLVVGLSLLTPSGAYNGAGGDGIARALACSAVNEAALLKLIFTVVTMAAGYRGGEIVPVFFIGATLGAALGAAVGLPAGFCAGLGLVCCFCAATKAPLAAFLLSLELFGPIRTPFFLLGCALSLFAPGAGLYGRKRFRRAADSAAIGPSA